jgi:DivIVA domain-containing protein
MATALIYVLVLLAVAAAIFVGVSAVFGRGEELAPIPHGASPTWLPDTGMAAADVRAVRFQQAVRGYRMAEVDWVLDHVAGELERLSEEHGRLHRRIAELERTPDEPATDEPTTDEPTPDDAAADDAATDEAATDEAATDEPATDEPTSDEAAVPTQEHTEA